MAASHLLAAEPSERFGVTERCAGCGNLNDISALAPLSEYACAHCGAVQRTMTRFRTFEIDEIVGRGGMGSVFRARDTILDRMVALKVMQGDVVADSGLRAALEREAMMAAAVGHAHIVKVFDAGNDGDTCYVSMELIEGGNLAEAIGRDGRLPELQMLNYGVQIAEALRAACQKGLLHRDIKPGNILIADAKNVKVTDFGLAATVEQLQKSQAPAWGTSLYVAPERAAAEPEDVRSDIYSLGVTLFHALAGTPPFEDPAQNGGKKVKRDCPDIRAMVPELSKETAELLFKALEEKPEKRFQNYDELVQALEYCRKKVAAQPKPSPARNGSAEFPPGQPAATTRSVELNPPTSPFLKKSASRTSAKLEEVDDEHEEMLAASSSAPKKSGGKTGVLIGAAAGVALIAAGAVAWTQGWIFGKGNGADFGHFQKPYEAAEALVLHGDYVKGAVAFQAIAQNAAASDDARDWAGFQQGIANLFAGEMAEARAAFQRVVNRKDRKQDPSRDYLIRVASQCASGGAASKSLMASLDRDTNQSVGLLAYGLLDWNMDDFSNSALYLRQFQSSHAPDVHGIASYKSVLEPYLKEISALNTVGMFDRTAPRDEQQKTLQRLNEALKDFRPNSPLRAKYQAKLVEYAALTGTQTNQTFSLDPKAQQKDKRNRAEAGNAGGGRSTNQRRDPSAPNPAVRGTYGAPATIAIRLAKPTKITRWTAIDWDGESDAPPATFRLQASEDGRTWRNVDECPQVHGQLMERNLPDLTTQYVRVVVNESGAGGDPKARLGAVELYGAEGKLLNTPAMESNLLHGKAVTDQGNSTADRPPAAGNDGLARTTWEAYASPCWLMVDLEKPTKIDHWIIVNAGATNPGSPGRVSARNTVYYKLQSSNDGAKWQDVDEVIDNHSDVTDRRVPEFTARYARIYVMEPSLSGDPKTRVGEFELFGPAN